MDHILYAVPISIVFPECELPVLVCPNGTATNRFSDGTVGVPSDWQETAESIFSDDDPEAFAKVDLNTGTWTYP